MIQTANSTPPGVNESPINYTSLPSNANAQTMELMKPNLAPSVGVVPMNKPTAPMTTAPAAPVVATPTTGMYSPQAGPTTQKVADATYASKMIDSVSGNAPVPSTDVSSGATYSAANTKRSTNEALLQQYLDQQKQYQDRYLSAIAPTQREMDLAKTLSEQKSQSAFNQERALSSGETSSFASGEAQRVARNDALKQMATASELDVLQNQRTGLAKQLEFLINSNDKSFKTQLDIQKLQSEISGIDKQAENTFFDLAKQYPDAQYTYDTTKTPVQNYQALSNAVTKSASYKAEQRRAEKLASSSTGSSAPKTLEERKAVVIDKFSQVLTPGHYINGVPFIDDKGKVTPEGWKAAITAAPGQGLPRKDFIEQYGYLLWTDRNGNADPKYGLTPKEQALISG